MPRAWVLVAATVLLASGCIGAGQPGTLDDASAQQASDQTAGNGSTHHLEQEAELSFTHVASPTGRATVGENCLRYPDPPAAENLTGTLEVTWTPTVPAFERLQVRLVSWPHVLVEAQGTSPLTASVDDVTPTGDDLSVIVDTPRDPAGAAVEQEATLAVDLRYEADEAFAFETGWGCTVVE